MGEGCNCWGVFGCRCCWALGENNRERGWTRQKQCRWIISYIVFLFPMFMNRQNTKRHSCELFLNGVVLSIAFPERNSAVPVGNFLPPMPDFSQNIYAENNIHNSMKLKLQLFPIDDSTRRALEMVSSNITYIFKFSWNKVYRSCKQLGFLIRRRINIILTWNLHFLLGKRYPQLWNT